MLSPYCIPFARHVVEKAATSIGPVASAEILPREAHASEQFFEFKKQ